LPARAVNPAVSASSKIAAAAAREGRICLIVDRIFDKAGKGYVPRIIP
jgi:hypothetical protein